MYTHDTKRKKKRLMMKNTTKDTFQADVIENSKLVVLYFSAPWCGPCRALGPVMEEISSEYGDRVEVIKVDVDEEEELAEAYQVTSIPVLKIISNGESKKTIIGAKPKPAIEAELANFLV
jgi:thioredoxin 1